MEDLTEKQLSMLRHMLGINTPWDKKPKPYRNYAAVVPDDPEYIELEKMGLVENMGRSSISDYDCYVCTQKGKAVAMESHRQIRYTKPRRRYRAYLSLTDGLDDLTFHEFLTAPEFKEVRDNA